jgi:hypothetical protein
VWVISKKLHWKRHIKLADQKNPNCIVTWNTHTPDRHVLICVMRIFTICSTFDIVTTDTAVGTETQRWLVVSRRTHWNGSFGFNEGQRISNMKCNQKWTGHCESVNIQILLKKALTSYQVPPRGVKKMFWKITQNRNIIRRPIRILVRYFIMNFFYTTWYNRGTLIFKWVWFKGREILASHLLRKCISA